MTVILLTAITRAGKSSFPQGNARNVCVPNPCTLTAFLIVVVLPQYAVEGAYQTFSCNWCLTRPFTIDIQYHNQVARTLPTTAIKNVNHHHITHVGVLLVLGDLFYLSLVRLIYVMQRGMKICNLIYPVVVFHASIGVEVWPVSLKGQQKFLSYGRIVFKRLLSSGTSFKGTKVWQFENVDKYEDDGKNNDKSWVFWKRRRNVKKFT